MRVDPKAMLNGARDRPGKLINTVPTAAKLSNVGSMATIIMRELWRRVEWCITDCESPADCSWRRSAWRARCRMARAEEEEEVGCGLSISRPFEAKKIWANGRLARCNISTTCCLLARLRSAACFTFHTITQTARKRKKQEKNTEKNTNRSMCS